MFRRLIATCFTKLRLLAFCCTGLLLIACSSGGGPQPNGALLRPLAPLLTIAPRQLSQQLTVSFRGKNNTLLAATLIDPQQVKISLLSPQGISLADITYNGQQVDAQQYVSIGRNIPPAALVADLQLAYWPLVTLRKTLPKSWVLREFLRNGQMIRQLWLDGNLHTEVIYHFAGNETNSGKWGAEIQLQQIQLGYSLSIKNL